MGDVQTIMECVDADHVYSRCCSGTSIRAHFFKIIINSIKIKGLDLVIGVLEKATAVSGGFPTLF